MNIAPTNFAEAVLYLQAQDLLSVKLPTSLIEAKIVRLVDGALVYVKLEQPGAKAETAAIRPDRIIIVHQGVFSRYAGKSFALLGLKNGQSTTVIRGFAEQYNAMQFLIVQKALNAKNNRPGFYSKSRRISSVASDKSLHSLKP